MIGSIEAGGTKFVCAIGNKQLKILKKITIPTTTPVETLNQVISFFKLYEENLFAIGVSSFGPIDIIKDSPTYGYITTTPKSGWQNFDFIGTLKSSFNLPINWTTDVNAAAYGEYIYGCERAISSLVYYTVGTGIGGGAIQNGDFIEGYSHPEMGHMIVRKHSEDGYSGNCPFHGDCLEGLASGPAIEQRVGEKSENIELNHVCWDIEAYYLAQCAYNVTLQLSPEKIIFGGGVMNQKHLINKIRSNFQRILNGYVKTPSIEDYIVLPKLGNDSGIIGGLALAKELIK
ncbi:MAG: ROK family protein [Vagococcus sp.]